jgi:nitrate/TMAO reductase-like tetraheme cytochrome c subunit
MRLGRLTLPFYAIGLLVGLGLVLAYGAIEVSSTPAFCGTCHVMAPYYESWEGSSHESIACVDCHIPPGVTAELRKKYEALAMVARYFTGTYGTNPWAEVDDAACLECHERRLLMGAEVFGEVLFDHGPHLTELRRGKRLRCTSCHSQIVQGSHITVTHTTCTLCHFKGQPAGEGTSECTLCHQVPSRVVDAEGVSFDHGDVLRFGMECVACHTPPSPMAGGVPRERCVTCHNEPARLAEYDDGDLLHRTHVSDHKVECTHCHLEIEHVAPRHLEAARSECSACHGAGHSPQRDLYAGIGGKGVPPMPDVMYQAGVRCEGCHLEGAQEATRRAGEVSCMSCHGPSYRRLFLAWHETIRERIRGLRHELDQTARLVRVRASPLFADARANLELVEKGRGIHNYAYSLALLSKAHSQINEARRSTGQSVLRAPWPEVPYETECVGCHAGIEIQQGSAFGRSFTHEPHVARGGLECETCHTTHEEREEAGREALRIGSEDCDSCHHGRSASPCTECHSDLRERTFPVDLGDFSHSSHVDDMELGCTSCHGDRSNIRASADRQVCADCH